MSHAATLDLPLSSVATDSPQFRATLQRNEDELDSLARWLDTLIRTLRLNEGVPKMIADMRLDPALAVLGEGSHTSDTLATVREALQSTCPISKSLVDSLHSHLILPLAQSAIRDLRDLREERRAHERAVEKYEAVVSRYAGLSRGKDASSFREEAFQLFEARKTYMTGTFAYVIKIERFKASIDHFLVDKTVLAMTAVLDYHQAMHDLFSALRPHLRDLSARLADWQLGANAALGALEPECKALIDRHKPYWNPTGPLLPPPSTTEAGAGNREIKQGYLFRRRMKGIGTPWKRVWAWIDAEGYFGTTAVGRERGTVEASNPISLLVAEARLSDAYDRRWCFEVLPSSAAPSVSLLVFQAESEDDLKDWLRTFQNARLSTVRPTSSSSLVQDAYQQDASSTESLTASTAASREPRGEQQQSSPVAPQSREPTVAASQPVSLLDQLKELRPANEELRVLFKDDIGAEEVCLLAFSAAVHRNVPGRVFLTQSRLYAASTVFGVETRTSFGLELVTRMSVNRRSFWIHVELEIVDGSLLALRLLHLLDDEADRTVGLLERIIDARRSVRPRTLDDLALALFPEMASTRQVAKSVGELVDCGCPEHLERTVYEAVLPIGVEPLLDILFGPECPASRELIATQRFTNLVVEDWTAGLAVGSTRQCRFFVPNPMLPGKETRSIENWAMLRHDLERAAIIEKTATTPDVLYGECFEIRVRYCLTLCATPGSDADGKTKSTAEATPGSRQAQTQASTKLVVCAAMRWLKSTIMKSIIRASANRITDDAILCMGRIVEEHVRKAAGSNAVIDKKALPGVGSSASKAREEERRRNRIVVIAAISLAALLLAVLAGAMHWRGRQREGYTCVHIHRSLLSSPIPACQEAAVIRADLLRALDRLGQIDRQLVLLEDER